MGIDGDNDGKSVREKMTLTVNEIVAHLISAHNSNRDVDLNKLKCVISRKYGLSNQPKLVDIILAVPPDYKVVQKHLVFWKKFWVTYCSKFRLLSAQLFLESLATKIES